MPFCYTGLFLPVISIHMSSSNQIKTSPLLRMDMYSEKYVKVICFYPNMNAILTGWMCVCVSRLLSLQNEVTLLRNEVAQLKQLLLAHKDCPVTLMQKKSGFHCEYRGV